MATISRDFTFDTHYCDVDIKKPYGSDTFIIQVDLGHETKSLSISALRAQQLKVALDEALQIYASETLGKTTKGAE